MDPIPILFTHYGDEWIRGSEIVLLDLLGALDKRQVIPIVWCNGREMAAACLEAGYKTYRSEFRTMFDYGSRPPNPRHYLETIRFGTKICRDHDIRVIHANSAAPAQWLVPISRKIHVPMLTHLHISYLKRSRYAFLLHCSNVVVGVSKQVLNGLKADGMADRRLRVIYNGINFKRLDGGVHGLRQRIGIPCHAVVVTTAGSLIKRKGHDILLQAFHFAARRNPDLHLVIMGDGPEEFSLRDITANLGIADRVHFLGQVREVSAVYAESDIFALASRNESFGLVLAEAGYVGLPVVATNVGGIVEVVENNSTGLLVVPDNISALSDALTRLIGDPALRRNLGVAARARIKTRFSLETMVGEFEKLYRELATQPAESLGWTGLYSQLRAPMASLMLSSGKTLKADTA